MQKTSAMNQGTVQLHQRRKHLERERLELIKLQNAAHIATTRYKTAKRILPLYKVFLFKLVMAKIKEHIGFDPTHIISPFVQHEPSNWKWWQDEDFKYLELHCKLLYDGNDNKMGKYFDSERQIIPVIKRVNLLKQNKH